MSKRWIAFCVLFLLIATACVGCTPDKKPDREDTDMKLAYKDIYKYTPQKTAELSGAIRYKASDGYVESMVQGYNNWYYGCFVDGSYVDATVAGENWKSGEITLNGGNMTSVSGASATRTFVAPMDGTVTIGGNAKLVDGKASANVLLADKVLASGEPADETGIWLGCTVKVKKGDKLHFVVEGNGTVYWNPYVDYTSDGEQLLHTAPDGYYGDVHPFYDEQTGKLYMYYLATGMAKNSFTQQFQSLATSSTDFVHFNDESIGISATKPPEQDLYFALGVYKDKNGVYRSSYGKGNYAGASMSTDLVEWQQGAEPYINQDDMLSYTFRAYFGAGVESGRDPDVMYDKDTDSYYCVVINYYSQAQANGEKGLALYVADGEGKFSSNYTKIVDFTGRGDPECPQLKKIGNRWYLFYSVYGTGVAGNVGNFRYRVSDENVLPQKVNWNALEEYSLDGGDLHAAQICSVGDKYYMFGWIGYRAGQNVWGGYLNLAREVYVGSDGLLYSRCDEYLTKLLNKGVTATVDGFANGHMNVDNVGGRGLVLANVSTSVKEYSAFVTLRSGSTTQYVGVMRREGKNYLVVTPDPNNAKGHVYVEIGNVEDGAELKVIVDGPFVEVFVADKYSLTAHTNLTTDVTYALSCSNATLNDVKICKLADLNNIFD